MKTYCHKCQKFVEPAKGIAYIVHAGKLVPDMKRCPDCKRPLWEDGATTHGAPLRTTDKTYRDLMSISR